MERYNEAAFDNYNQKALEQCSGCGRTFTAEALVKHQKNCLKKTGISTPSNNQDGMNWDS